MPSNIYRIEQLKTQLAQQEQASAQFAILKTLKALCALEPGVIEWRFKSGLALFDVGKIDAAIQTFEKCQEDGLDDLNLTLNLGHAYQARGEVAKASALYRELSEGSDDAMASVGYWSLADQKGYNFSDQERQSLLDRAERLDTSVQHRFLTMFALGCALEQQKEYAEAFSAMRQGNDQVANTRPFDARGYRKFAESLMTIKKAPLANHTVTGANPIFIVGMPRSGSTLVEQILASHSAVEVTNELPYIERMARQLDRQGGFARVVAQLTTAQRQQGAAAYLQEVRPFLQGEPSAFVDKWPNNFWYIGLIKTLFPKASIINMVRDPIDNAMGIYKQYFSHGNEHSFKLDSIVSYWQSYLLVMEHWDSLYPDQLLHLRYESLVADPDSQIKKLFDFCGLEFEEQSLRFYESDRVVMTPSGNQVRQPIYSTAVGGGMRYSEQLKAHLPQLEKLREQIEKQFLNK